MTIVVHAFHAGLVLVGLAAVVLLLHQSAVPQARLDALRDAAKGDHLVADAERRALELLMGPGRQLTPSPDRWTIAVSVGSVAAAAIHAFVSPEHYTEGLRFGLFFTLLTATQLAAAVAVLARPAPRLISCVALVNAAVVVLWGVSRTVGLPFGLAEVERVGIVDSLCSLIEVGVVLCCLVWIQRRNPARLQDSSLRPFAPATSKAGS